MLQSSFVRYFLIAAIVFSPALFFHSRQVLLLYPAEIFLYIFILDMLENLSKKAFLIVNTILISVTLLFTSYGIVTGMPVGYQVFASVFETNVNEAFEFASSSFFFKIVFTYLFLFIVSIYLLLKKRDSDERLHKRKEVLFVASLLFMIYPFHFYNKFDYYPENVINMFQTYIGTIHDRVEKYIANRYVFEGDRDEKKELNLILVIGEASRRYSYSLYGYKRETNPRLQKDKENMILFTDVYTVAPYTRVAVPSLLSTSSVEQFSRIYNYPTLIRIFNSLKIPTTVLSNQTINLDSDIFISAIFKEASEKFFLQKLNNGYFDKILYDQQLLPELKKSMRENAIKNKFIIMHLMGSHYKYENRYPKERRFFLSDAIIDHYDNSIRYTDFVLSIIKKMIRKSDSPYAVLYLSDHGEYLNEFNDGIYGHGVKEITYFELEIPFILFYNDKFKQRYKKEIANMVKNRDKKISLDNVSHTVLGLWGIHPKSYDAESDLSSDKFRQKPRSVILHDMKVKNVENIKIRTGS